MTSDLFINLRSSGEENAEFAVGGEHVFLLTSLNQIYHCICGRYSVGKYTSFRRFLSLGTIASRNPKLLALVAIGYSIRNAHLA